MKTSACIVAHGMVTSLGGDVATSCAAARAGLVRAQTLEGLRYVSCVDGEPAPVVVHAAPLVTLGFEGDVRLERLLSAALLDLKARLDRMGVDASEEASCGFYLSLPSPLRTLSGSALIANDEARAAHAQEAREAQQAQGGPAPDPASQQGPAQAADEAHIGTMLQRAAQMAGWAGSTPLHHVSQLGHAGGAHSLAMAARDLAQGRVSLAIVAAADSLLDDATLEWLHASTRLKLPDMPVGLRPGEAAAAVALIDAGHARAHACTAQLLAIEAASESRTLLSGATSVGEGLAIVLDAAGRQAGWAHEQAAAWLVSDHNGEVYRANEWGHALVRLRQHHAAIAEPEVWMPAQNFGDTGAASGLIGVVTAMAAFERGYAPAGHAVIASSSEDKARAAVLIARTSASSAKEAAHGWT